MTDESGSVPEWFRGAVDLHVHSRPSIFPRLLDDREVAEQAAAAGMRAVVLKAHEGSTVARAQLAQSHLASLDSGSGTGQPALDVRGGVVLNRFVGGINPSAVELALGMGAALVWMPTIHAGNHLDYYGEAGFKEQASDLRARAIEPLTVLRADGNLKPEVLEVLEVMAAGPDAVLNNGHLRAAETAVLFREAKRRGIERLMVAHPELPLTGYSLDFQLEMADLGAVIERCYLPHLRHWGGFPIERTAKEIARIGAERCVLSTDFGQVSSPAPADGLERFGRQLIENGVGEVDVARMMRTNPAELLGLD